MCIRDRVGLIRVDRSNAGVNVDIVVQGDVVVARRGNGHVPLAKIGVDEAPHIGAVVVICLLYTSRCV